MCELNVSSNIYAHQESPDVRRFLQTLDPDAPQDDVVHEDHNYVDNDSIAKEHWGIEQANDFIFYDRRGNVIDPSQLTVATLDATCEFIGTKTGHLISRTMPGDALIKETNSAGQVTTRLARIFSVLFDVMKQPRLSYFCFLDDSQLENVACKEERKTIGVDRFVCNAFVCLFDKHDTLLENYQWVAKKLKRRAARQRLNQVGMWSRKLGKILAYQHLDFMDTCDFLEFYHIPEKWMWASRIGNYVCQTFVQPLLHYCVRTPKAASLFATAGNASCMSLSFCETIMPCAMCDGSFGRCSIVVNIDNGVHVATDKKCANILYLMFSICQTLTSFRNLQTPKQKQNEILHNFLTKSRATLHREILNA